MLQKEICNLKQIIETQKQNLNGKIKKSALEYKQQIENIEEEKDKLQLLNQQLSTDLDSCREHIASKNKEILKLQEEILVLEDNVRECKVKQKHAEDMLKIEADKQMELHARFEAQEEELKRLRNFLARKVEQSGDSDKTMWQEMNRVIQDLSRQMTTHLDSTRGGDKEKSPESLVSRLRKQVAEVQGELSTEKSLHQITKTSLVALEEDCQRLRKQLHHYRRRDPPSGEKKHKNRMEAINAIIARSQSQAQALLSSGGYFDDSMVSPRVRTHQASTRVGFHSPRHADSPDNSYCEDLSVASLPPMHYGLPSSKS
ncbi:myosin-10-like [Ruditapes philippinarum]|uniref:myosin-10-like n=1 Tax=Ruditapes philippinarum TaxID=129788 RepID=UPI00295AF58E|nr:myosin-10-like [Ruditapes philippinarum]